MLTRKHVDFEIPAWQELAMPPTVWTSYANRILEMTPVAYWRALVDGSLPDLSPNHHHGTPNSATFGDVDGTLFRDANPAIGFDGSGGVAIHGALSFIVNNQPFTIICWVRTLSTTFGCFVSSQASGATGPGMQLGLNGGTTNGVILRLQGTGRLQVLSSAGVNDGEWHHIAATYDGSGAAAGAAIWIDGSQSVSINSDSLAGSIQQNTGHWLGTRIGSQIPLTGDLDEVAVFDRVLTAGEITDLHDRGRGVVRVAS